MTRRWRIPQPFEEVDHTADAGVVVHGRSESEALALLVLALGQLLAGGEDVARKADVQISVGPGTRDSIAVDVLRELLYRFDCDHVIPESCQVDVFGPDVGARVTVGVGDYDPERHCEGLELKAVTLHEARFEAEDDGFTAQVIFDI
jgi:SHS2 domain-containing protein